MYSLIFEYYNLSNYDTRPGAGISLKPNKILGTTVGDMVQRGDIYDKFQIDEDEDDIIIDEESMEAVGIKLNNPVYNTDPKRSTVSHTGGNMRQAPGLNEKNKNTTKSVKGISPRLTYRGASQKGPAFGAQSSALYIRNAPGRKSGTQYGTSRAPIVIDDDPLEFGDSLKDKSYIALDRHERRIKKIKDMIDNIENE
jgi:hypothetical protein